MIDLCIIIILSVQSSPVGLMSFESLECGVEKWRIIFDTYFFIRAKFCTAAGYIAKRFKNYPNLLSYGFLFLMNCLIVLIHYQES